MTPHEGGDGAMLDLFGDCIEIEGRAGSPVLAPVLLRGFLLSIADRLLAELSHGDVIVWGGPSRLAHHGVMPLKDGFHPALGRQRINLTFRNAL